MRPDPLILYCSPRGGSSLVAGVFVNHGFWVGKTFGGPDGIGTGGYINYENARIKQFLKTYWPMKAGVPCVVQQNNPPPLVTFCRRIIPPETPWLFKGSCEYYPIFQTYFPSHVAVFVFRDPVQAVEAHVRRRGEAVRKDATRIVEQRYQYMQDLVDAGRGTRVQAEDIVNGDISSLVPVLEHYGIDPDPQRGLAHIKKRIWHT